MLPCITFPHNVALYNVVKVRCTRLVSYNIVIIRITRWANYNLFSNETGFVVRSFVQRSKMAVVGGNSPSYNVARLLMLYEITLYNVDIVRGTTVQVLQNKIVIMDYFSNYTLFAATVYANVFYNGYKTRHKTALLKLYNYR